MSLRHCPETLQQFSALHLLFVFISNWKRRKGEAACYSTFCLSADTGSYADARMENERQKEKIFKAMNLHFNMCDCEIISSDCWEDTVYLPKHRGTGKKEFSVSEKIP